MRHQLTTAKYFVGRMQRNKKMKENLEREQK